MSTPDVKQSKAEKINADIGFQKKKFFAQNYDYMNVDTFEDAMTGKTGKILAGRASADTFQQLTRNMAFNPNKNTTNLGLTGAADMALAYNTQLGKANQQATAIQNQRAGAALGVATGQEADTSKTMSLLSNLGASTAIADARNKQMVNMGIIQGGTTLGGNIIGSQADKFRAENPNQSNWATKLSDFLNIS